MLKKLLLLLLTSLFIGIYSCSQSTVLTATEKKWLQENDSLKVAIFPYYPPYQFVNKYNNIDGIFIEYLELIEKKIDCKFQKEYYKDWPILIQDVKNNKIDIILEIQETNARKSYLSFHSPFFESKHVIITRKEATFGSDIHDLLTKTVALPQDYAITENLRTKYPSLNIVTHRDELTCLQKLNSGEYDAYIGPRAVVNYFIRSHKLNNLKINSEIDFTYEPGLAVNKHNKILNKIIDKTITSITREERESLLNNWFYNAVTPFYQTTQFWILFSLISLLSLMIATSFNAYLKFKIRQRTEELLIAKDIAEESNRLKTNFIKNIPSEIRSPMNEIIDLSGFLNSDELTQEKRKKYTRKIIGNSKELLTTIDNILEVSKLQTKRFTVKLTEVNLYNVLKELVTFHEIKSKEKNNKLYLDTDILDHQNLCILMDRTKLKKVLTTFINNAITYTNNGDIKISCILEDSSLKISIKDNGIGICPKKQPIINESLAATINDLYQEYEGLGLGLIIAKKNADIIGGQITFNSHMNEGTTFTLTLPYTPVAPSKKRNRTNQKEKKRTKEQKHIILIAEDGETNFLFLKTILTKMIDYEFIIYRAKNGKEAVTICQENENINMVLMDIKMPIMDGYDATKYIKKMRPDLPIIAQTAYSIEEDVQKALDAGCDDFVSKPVDRKILKPILQKYFSVFKNKKEVIN